MDVSDFDIFRRCSAVIKQLQEMPKVKGSCKQPKEETIATANIFFPRRRTSSLPMVTDSTHVDDDTEKIVVFNFEENKDDDEGCRNKSMTFQKLPYDCKHLIFSLLNDTGKAIAERVCSSWKKVIESPALWKNVDLSQSATFCQNKSTPNSSQPELALDIHSINEFKSAFPKNKSEAEAEYERYKLAVTGYLDYLKKIKPSIRNFKFAFDIGDSQDGLVAIIRNFLESVPTKNIKRATLNWKETPAKPSALVDSSNTWSTGNYSDLIYKHRRRQRAFVLFFDWFTALAPNLEYLSLPFDWSPSPIANLSRLGPTLKELVLDEYFVPQPLEQSLLAKLLASLPHLEKLSIGMVLGSGLGMLVYKLSSPSLRFLDLSKCQGFALAKVDLPNLKDLRTTNASFPSQLFVSYGEVVANRSIPTTHSVQNLCSSSGPAPIHMPLKSSKSLPSLSTMQGNSLFPVPLGIPCLFNVLKRGAPSLEKLNDYRLTDNWRTGFDPKLDKILYETCPCVYHYQHHLDN